MNPFKYAYCLLMLCFLLTNCEETIDFEPPKSIQNAIFIEGKLTKGTPSNVFVKIGQVFNFSSNPSLLLAQSVHLMDESGQSLELTSREQGIFKLTIPDNHPTFKVDYGKAYKIRLQLKNQRHGYYGNSEVFLNFLIRQMALGALLAERLVKNLKPVM